MQGCHSLMAQNEASPWLACYRQFAVREVSNARSRVAALESELRTARDILHRAEHRLELLETCLSENEVRVRLQREGFSTNVKAPPPLKAPPPAAMVGIDQWCWWTRQNMYDRILTSANNRSNTPPGLVSSCESSG